MAGIAGIQGTDSGELNLMLERIRHRGPHETWTNRQRISMGCCELDVGRNSKPGAHYASDGQRAVVLDGRIYNQEKANMTDAGAVLYFYDMFGTNFAQKLHGNFACAISDGEELILARDTLGVKPLYYGHSDGRLVFASELKSLVGLADDVKEFPPGYVYSWNLGFQQYCCSAVETPEFQDFEQGKKVLANLLAVATERRMRDNAIGGVFLSGGLDSSLILLLAKEVKPDIEAFTVSMEGGTDLPLAREVTRYLGVKHHVLMFGEKEIMEILPQAVHHIEMFEESCVHGAIANFLAARFVSPHTSCVLTGEGADETLAGYDGQFRRGKSPEEVACIVDLLSYVAHNTALQRLDRLMAAHSMEARTPFVDAKVVDFAAKIPLSCKIHGQEQIGKWILRRAFEGRLPDSIIFQTKRFFAQGSGVAGIMRSLAGKHVSESELAEHNRAEDNPYLASAEELYYYRIFKETFPQPTFDRLVGRWDPTRTDFFRRYIRRV